MSSPTFTRNGLLFTVAVACVAAACDFDIPPLPGGGGTSGGAGGEGGGSCAFVGCPECGEQQVCDPVMGCVQCLENADCTDADVPVCDGNRCVECTLANLDRCQDGDVCSQSRCANPCSVANDCVGGGEFCQGEACKFGRCICCEMNTDCTQDNNNVCTPNGLCKQCVTDSDCAGFEGGTKEKCRADGVCVACLVAEDCAQPAVCNTSNTCDIKCCETKHCVIDSDAPVCDTATNSCVACTGPDQCLQGDCVEGRCIECQGDDDCTNDEKLPACVNNICRECSASHACASPNVCVVAESKCYAPT